MVSTVTGTNTDPSTTPQYFTDDTLFVDISLINTGGAVPANTPFNVNLELDGTIHNTFSIAGINTNEQRQFLDINIGRLSQGPHSVRMVIDPVTDPTNFPNGNIVEATEGSDNIATKSFNVALSAPTVTSSANVAATSGQFFSYTIDATNNPTSFSTSNLPNWLGLAGNVISGTPPISFEGGVSFTVSAYNSTGHGDLVVNLTVNAQPPVITSQLSATAFLGVFFNYTMSATGTNPTFSMSPNSLEGLTFASPSLSGLTTGNDGVYTVTMTAQNSAGSVSQVLTLTVLGPPIFSSSLQTGGREGVNFNYQITATGNPTKFDQDPSDATLLNTLGLTLNNSTGLISGVPPVGSAGTYEVHLFASNPGGTGRATLIIGIGVQGGSEPVIFSPINTKGVVGVPFFYQISATNSPTSFSTTALPPGLQQEVVTTVNPDTSVITTTFTGNIIGKPTAIGSSTFDITATNAAGTSLTTTVNIVVTAVPPVITSPKLVVAKLGIPFAYNIAATGGPTNYDAHFDMFADFGLPTWPGPLLGLSVDTTTGLISGTPSVPPNLYFMQVFATNASGTGSAPYPGVAVAVNSAGSSDITSASTQTGIVGQPFNYQILASGATSFNADFPHPPNNVAAAGFIPHIGWPDDHGLAAEGLTIDGATGIISGAPLYPGVFWAKLWATGPGGTSYSLLTITVLPASAGIPVITSPTAVVAPTNSSFDYQITATNSPTSYSAAGLPAGLSINTVTGRITGTVATPTAVPLNVTINAKNSSGTGSATLALVIYDNTPGIPIITSTTTQATSVGVPYQYKIIAANNASTIDTVTALPPNLTFGSLSNSTRTFSGTVTTAGRKSILMRAVNGVGPGYAVLDLNVRPAPDPINSVLNGFSTVGTSFTYIISTQGASSIFYRATQVPNGLSLGTSGANAGIISGTPQVPSILTTNISAYNTTGADTELMMFKMQGVQITSPILTLGTVGDQNFSYQIAGTGSPNHFDAIGLPPGLQVNTSTGLITGTPLAPSDPSNPYNPVSSFKITISASNAFSTGTQDILFKISQTPNTPIIQPPLTATGTDGAPFSYQVVATVPLAAPPVNGYDAPNGLPPGLSINTTTGLISGTASLYGNYNVLVTATNANGTGGAIITITINPVLPTITSPLFVTGIVGDPFRYDISAAGTAGITYTSSAPPAGLTLSGPSITGIPTTAGTTSVVLTATNVAGSTNATLIITIYEKPKITSALSKSVIVGTSFSYTITATGTTPIDFTASPLPQGLSLSGATISGTPTQVGFTDVRLIATNITGPGKADIQFLRITVLPLVITSPTVQTGTLGQPFVYQITTNSPANTFGATGLPSGLTINTSSGVIAGAPTVAGTFAVIISASNGPGLATQTLIIAISQGGAPAITSPLSVAGVINTPFFYTITASNSPASFGASTLSPAPTLAALGLSLNPVTGDITGTPVISGSFSLVVTATNSNGTGTATVTLGISAAPGTPAILSPLTATGMEGLLFTYQIQATNTPTSFTATNLPPGLTIDTNKGLISGIPSLFGTYVTTITAINGVGSGSANVTISISQATIPIINSPLVVSATVGVPFLYVITAGAFPTSFTAANLPPGLTVDTSSGLISGTPLLSGTYAVPISASNSNGTSPATTLTINVGTAPGAPVITSPTTAGAIVGQTFTYQITASGAPTSFNAFNLPAGYTVNTTTGVITAVPTSIGTFTVIIAAINGSGMGTTQLTINSISTLPFITSADTVAGNVGVPLNYAITATGIQPISFTVSTLPSGLSFSGNSIVGNPQAEGSFAVLVTATNSVGNTSKTVTFNIGPPVPPTIVSPSSTVALTQVAFNFTVVVAGSQPVTLQASGLPPGLILAGSQITGVPSTVGSFAVTLTATNVAGTTTQTLVISVFGITPNIDSDGDGFPDELEFFLGTDPLNANSTPFRGAAANADPFHLAAPKLSVKLDFVNLEKDMLTLTGTLPLPAGFTAPGQRMVVDIGGVIKSATLDRRGSFTSSDKKTSMKLNAAKSKASGVNAKYSIKLRGTFRQQLSDEGLTNVPANKATRDVILILLVGEVAYQKTTTLLYSCKNNKANAR